MEIIKVLITKTLMFSLILLFCIGLLATAISLKTGQNIVSIAFEESSEQTVELIQNALTEVATNAPIVGNFLKLILSCYSTQSINQSSGFEQALSFVVIFVLTNWALAVLYSKPSTSTYTNRGAKIIDVISNIIILVIISVFVTSSAMIIIDLILEHVRSFGVSYSLYNIILTGITIIIMLIYCAIKSSKGQGFKSLLTVLTIDLCISMLVLCLCSMITTVMMVGSENLTQKDLMLMFFFTVGIPTFAVPYMIYLKIKYDPHFLK